MDETGDRFGIGVLEEAFEQDGLIVNFAGEDSRFGHDEGIQDLVQVSSSCVVYERGPHLVGFLQKLAEKTEEVDVLLVFVLDQEEVKDLLGVRGEDVRGGLRKLVGLLHVLEVVVVDENVVEQSGEPLVREEVLHDVLALFVLDSDVVFVEDLVQGDVFLLEKLLNFVDVAGIVKAFQITCLKSELNSNSFIILKFYLFP